MLRRGWPLAAALTLALFARPALANSWDVEGGLAPLFDGAPVLDRMTRRASDAATAAYEAEGVSVLVMGRRDVNLLCIAREGEDGWALEETHLLAVRQGEEAAEITLAQDAGGYQFTMTYADPWPLSYTFAEADGGWALAKMTSAVTSDAEPLVATREDAGFRFRQGDAEILLPWQGPLTLDAFVVQRFPDTMGWLEGVNLTMLSGALRLPGAQTVLAEAERTLPVYQGPGKAYYRAARGGAMMSTREPFVVYGEENGWLLIGYTVQKGVMRFGYVETSKLGGVQAPKLALAPVQMPLTMSTEMKFDPVYFYEIGPVFDAGTPVTYLAMFDVTCAFVEAQLDGEPVRGFVSAANLLP